MLRLLREEGQTLRAAAPRIGRSLQCIAQWRKEDPDFGQEIKLLLAQPARSRVSGPALLDWRKRWVEGLRTNQTRISLLDELNLTTKQVVDELQSNEAFAFEVEECRRRRLWMIEDSLEDRAMESAPAARYLLSRSPAPPPLTEDEADVDWDPMDEVPS